MVGRPAVFCSTVEMQSTLSVAGETSLSSHTSISSDLTVTGSITCGSICAHSINWDCMDDDGEGMPILPAPSKFKGGTVFFEGGVDIKPGTTSRAANSSLNVQGTTSLQRLSTSGEATIGSLLVSGDTTITGNVVGGEATFTTVSTPTFILGGRTVRLTTINFVSGVVGTDVNASTTQARILTYD